MNYYQNQSKLLFPSKIKKFPATSQTIERFVIKAKEKQKSIVQRPVYFTIFQNKKKVILEREKLDNFICPKKEKPKLLLENVYNVMIEKLKRIKNSMQTLNQLHLPAMGNISKASQHLSR